MPKFSVYFHLFCIKWAECKCILMGVSRKMTCYVRSIAFAFKIVILEHRWKEFMWTVLCSWNESSGSGRPLVCQFYSHSRRIITIWFQRQELFYSLVEAAALGFESEVVRIICRSWRCFFFNTTLMLGIYFLSVFCEIAFAFLLLCPFFFFFPLHCPFYHGSYSWSPALLRRKHSKAFLCANHCLFACWWQYWWNLNDLHYFSGWQLEMYKWYILAE